MSSRRASSSRSSAVRSWRRSTLDLVSSRMLVRRRARWVMRDSRWAVWWAEESEGREVEGVEVEEREASVVPDWASFSMA